MDIYRCPCDRPVVWHLGRAGMGWYHIREGLKVESVEAYCPHMATKRIIESPLTSSPSAV